MLIARRAKDGREQLLYKHSENVAQMAASFAQKIGAQEMGRVVGQSHDFGKVTEEWQAYLRGDAEKVRHSIFGAKRVDRLCSDRVVAEFLSNVIAAHHTEVYDNLSPDGSTPLHDRLRDTEDLQISSECIDTAILTDEFQRLIGSIPATERKLFMPFYLGLLEKFVYSCLVDADRYDAYLFDCNETYTPDVRTDWSGLLKNLENHLKSLDDGTVIADLCKQISDDCARSGSLGVGIYKFEAPTGGGKTLSSFRFGLSHVIARDFDRIIYVSPYLTILTQTADKLRAALGLAADSDVILEHHSAYSEDGSDAKYRLHTDRWDAPIVLTTQVQFLESVFSARGSDLRKFHSMARSLIIFDEIQSIPVKCVHLFNGVINFLHSVCGSSILLCTATQPLLDKVEKPVYLTQSESISKHVQMPERYRIVPDIKPIGYTYSELASFVLSRNARKILVIVNTKKSAKELYSSLQNMGVDVIHLSKNMCDPHIADEIVCLREKLKGTERVICVATQLIEAGVDISFECVIREIAGFDSILQAAGRCNRYYEYGCTKDVYIVTLKDSNFGRLKDISEGARVTLRLLGEGIESIEDAVNRFYTYYFYARKNDMNYSVRDGGTLFDWLSKNKQGTDAYISRIDKRELEAPLFRCACRSAAEEFFVVERGRVEVIVPYGKSERLLELFASTEDAKIKSKILRQLNKYSVSLYDYQLKELQKRSALDTKSYSGLIVLEKGFYHKERGVDIDGCHEFLCV